MRYPRFIQRWARRRLEGMLPKALADYNDAVTLEIKYRQKVNSGQAYHETLRKQEKVTNRRAERLNKIYDALHSREAA